MGAASPADPLERIGNRKRGRLGLPRPAPFTSGRAEEPWVLLHRIRGALAVGNRRTIAKRRAVKRPRTPLGEVVPSAGLPHERSGVDPPAFRLYFPPRPMIIYGGQGGMDLLTSV